MMSKQFLSNILIWILLLGSFESLPTVANRPSSAPTFIKDSFLFSSRAAVYPSGGVGLDYCRTDDNCAGSRSCYFSINDPVVFCNETTPNCYCRHGDRTECLASEDCSTGERCYLHTQSTNGAEEKFCWSCRLQLTPKLLIPTDDNPPSCKDVWLGNYTGDICSGNYRSCAGNRKCVQFLDDNSTDLCAYSTEPCFCLPTELKKCTSSAACENGERCARNENGSTACFSCGRVEADERFTAVDDDAVCTTPSPSALTDTRESPSPSPSVKLVESIPPEPQPCIAVSHLTHLGARGLVFQKHVRASILCDPSGSCATPAHMVTFHEQAMMMKTYCSIIGTCSKRVGWVNSPRMDLALRVSSNTEQLMFTAFAARYESTFEEMLLRLLILFRL